MAIYFPGLQPYQCVTCERRFTARSSLERHQRIHSGEMPYTCKMCHQSFARSDHLKEHRKTVHSDQQPARFQRINSIDPFLDDAAHLFDSPSAMSVGSVQEMHSPHQQPAAVQENTSIQQAQENTSIQQANVAQMLHDDSVDS